MSLLGYRWLYATALGFAQCARPFSRKIRAGLNGRRGLSARVRALRETWSERPVWFHVASSGELEQCFPLLEEMKRRRPSTPLFLTYFSPTARRGLELERERRARAGLSVPWDGADFAPFDLKHAVDDFLDALRPTDFIAIHREIWPVLLEECRARGVHCYLFATYFPPRSQRWLPWLKKSLGLFEAIGTNEASTAKVLRAQLPATTSVEIVGDPRVERVLRRKAMQSPPTWVKYFDGQNTLVLASLWPKDLEKISLGVEVLLKSGEPWRIIAVPHEPSKAFVDKCVAHFSKDHRVVRKWSSWSKSPDRESHLVVDTVGILAELYRVATLVFVGGSFRARVHNVLEPAAYGKAILTGPYIENSGEALELWKTDEALVRANNEDEFRDALALLARRPELRRQSADLMGEYLGKRSGAAEKYVSILLKSHE